MTNNIAIRSGTRGRRITAEHVERAIEDMCEHHEMEAFARGELSLDSLRPRVEMLLVDQRGMVGPISDEGWNDALERIATAYTLVGATPVAPVALPPSIAGMEGVIARTAIAARTEAAPTGIEESDRIADLLAMFDACKKRQCDLHLFESVEPGGQYALRLWASANNLKVVVSRHDARGTISAFAVLTVDVAPYHHHYTVTVGLEVMR